MYDDRVIIPFPRDTIRLNGILQDTLSAIHCATSNLTYKDYLSIRSTFLFVSEAVILEALKSVSIKNELVLDSKAAVTFAAKHIGNMSVETVLTALFIASMEKAIVIHSEIGLESFVNASAEKSVDAFTNELVLSDLAHFLLEKAWYVYSSIGMESFQADIAAEKGLEQSEALCEISSAADLLCEKYSGDLIGEMQFSSIVKFALTRFRLLKDVDGLSFADIDEWTMDTFDMMQI